jgi:SAM-dependent methyltransferase
LSEFEYTGTDTLENLQIAVNYNNTLTSLVVKNSKPGLTLDFGAGIGTFSDKVRDSFEPICLEIDQTQAKILENKNYSVVSKVDVNTYDYIYSLNVLEHIENDKEEIIHLFNGLKPGGKIFIFVPAFNFLYSSLDKKVGHFRRYNKKMIKELVSHPDIKISKLKYFDTTGFFFSIVFKLLNLQTDQVNERNIKIFDSIFFPINRILDPIFNYFFGKNVFVVLEKK